MWRGEGGNEAVFVVVDGEEAGKIELGDVDLTVLYVGEGGEVDAIRMEEGMDDEERRAFMTPERASPTLTKHAEERELENWIWQGNRFVRLPHNVH